MSLMIFVTIPWAWISKIYVELWIIIIIIIIIIKHKW